MKKSPLIIAHYMTWYQTPDISGSWGFWQVNRPGIDRAYWHEPGQTNQHGAKDIASVYYPVIGPYDSADPDLCEYHILLAKLAGIDAFVCDWYGFEPWPEHPYDNTGFAALLKKAEALHFNVGICWEDRAMFAGGPRPAQTRSEAVQFGRATIQQMDREYFNSPAYLRMDGRPVLMNFAWGEPGDTVNDCWLYPSEWREVLEASKEKPLLIHDYQAHHKQHYLTEYESMAPWGSCLHGRSDLPEFWGEADAALGKSRFSFLSGTARPGFDNRGCGGWGNDIALDERGDGTVYREIWNNLLKHDVRFIQIATWNDFNEGGTIEPTRTGITHSSLPVEGYGYRELETTRSNAAVLGKSAASRGALFLPERLYALRKRVAAGATKDLSNNLNLARDQLLARQPEAAAVLMNAVEMDLNAAQR
ncbi:MAG: endo-1,3-alpha-glucanase family glycosylhydrolase [Lentisphaerota bacterium]